MTNELAVRDSTALAASNGLLMPVAQVKEAITRREMIGAFARQVMIEGTDYGKIPGAGDKKVLLKAGAEKLSSFFGLVPDFQVEERILDYGDDEREPLIYYRVRCDLYRDGTKVGSGQASCSSRERKYRYRNEWINGQKRQVINREVADIDNTILKMADKRALVAATLLATNVSDHFTQDIDDDEDANTVTVQAKPAPPQAQSAEGISEKSMKKMHAIGIKLYGKDAWSQKRAEMVAKLTNNQFTSATYLTEEQAQRIITGMDDRLKASAAQLASQADNRLPGEEAEVDLAAAFAD